MKVPKNTIYTLYTVDGYMDATITGKEPDLDESRMRVNLNGKEYSQIESVKVIGEENDGYVEVKWSEKHEGKNVDVRFFHAIYKAKDGTRGFALNGATKKGSKNLIKALESKYGKISTAYFKYKCPDGCCDMTDLEFTLAKKG